MRKPAIGGTVTPPQDLQPAIDALSEMGKAWLKKRTKGRAVTPLDLAQAGDFERGELPKSLNASKGNGIDLNQLNTLRG